jgi:hypothetical protein
MPQSSQSRLDAQTATVPPVRPDGPEELRFLDHVANACRVKHLAYRNLPVETYPSEVLPKEGTGPVTERSPEWLVTGFSGEWTATVPLVDRSGQVVSRQPLQRGPEPAVRPALPHFPAGTSLNLPELAECVLSGRITTRTGG